MHDVQRESWLDSFTHNCYMVVDDLAKITWDRKRRGSSRDQFRLIPAQIVRMSAWRWPGSVAVWVG